MEASGWPASCITEKKKKKIVEDVFVRERIRLEPAKRQINPGRKSVAEIMLNAFG